MKSWIASGIPKIGTVATLPNPAIAEIIASAGFDWVWIDGEHGGFDEINASTYCAVAGSGLKTFVRLPDKSATSIKRYLDIGCDGIILPQVNSRAEVKEICRSAIYPPKGERSVGIARSHGYGARFSDYISNRQYSIIIQIETADGVANIDDILQEEDVGAVIIGPYDLSGSLSVIGNVGAQVVVDAISTVLLACKRASKPCGIFAGNADIARSYAQQGFDIIGVGIDTMVLLNAFKALISQTRS